MVRKEELYEAWSSSELPHVITEYDEKLPINPEPCVWAQEFSNFCAELVATLDTTSPPVKYRQAKYLLTERYMEFRAKAPRGHRDTLGSKKHICGGIAVICSLEMYS